MRERERSTQERRMNFISFFSFCKTRFFFSFHFVLFYTRILLFLSLQKRAAYFLLESRRILAVAPPLLFFLLLLVLLLLLPLLLFLPLFPLPPQIRERLADARSPPRRPMELPGGPADPRAQRRGGLEGREERGWDGGRLLARGELCLLVFSFIIFF